MTLIAYRKNSDGQIKKEIFTNVTWYKIHNMDSGLYELHMLRSVMIYQVLYDVINFSCEV